MSKFLRGLATGAAAGTGLAIQDILERRRAEGIARLQAQLNGEQYQRQRADQVADTKAANERDDRIRADTAQREEDRFQRKLDVDREIAEINARRPPPQPQPQYDSAIIEEPVTNPDGSVVLITNAQGEKVPLTRKVPQLFNRFTGQFGPTPSGKSSDPVDIPDDVLKRLRGEDQPAPAAAPPPASGLLNRAAALPEFKSREEAVQYGLDQARIKREQQQKAEAQKAADAAEKNRRASLLEAARLAEFGASNPPPAPARTSRGINY